MGSSETLRSVIDAGASSKRLDELSSARVIGKIAMQVHAAQQKAGAGKAIGPITPARISLASNGEAKLEGGEASSLGYSAPEQITGSAGDRRSDVFSLGTVMWEALTHQRLFDAMNDAAVRIAVQDRAITPPAEINANIPAELSAICMRALARNPTDRYQSLKAMAVEIEEFLDEAGYTDDDAKIAQYLAAMAGAAKKAAAPASKPPGDTRPPPSTLRPAAAAPTSTPANVPVPSILKDEPRPKSPSGAALAAALANASASSSSGSGGTKLPAASSSATSIGLAAGPVASEWQDKSAPSHAPPPAAAPVVPLTPMPPILPSGSEPTSLRNDKSTISVAVPPQVRVATTIDAKHAEAKPSAVIVEDEPSTPKPAGTQPPATKPLEAPPVLAAVAIASPPKTTLAEAPPPVDTKITLVDGSLAPAVVNAKLDATNDTFAAAFAKVEPVSDKTADYKSAKAATSAQIDAKHETTAEAKTLVKDKDNAQTLVKDKDDAKTIEKPAVKSAAKADDKKATPNPADAVSLPNRDSKGDLLAGWGWGTDKHDALAPAGYTPDDDDLYEQPSSKKTLTYVIGGGLAVALLIVVVAFAAGGSNDKKTTPKEVKLTPEQAELAAAGRAAAAENAAAQQPAPAPPPAVDEAKLAADKAAADKVAADKATADAAAAAEQAKADEAARVKAEATKAKLDAEAAAAKVKAESELAKKSDAERKKAEAEATKLAEAQRKADAKKAADEAKKLALEDAAKRKAEADAARAAKRAEADKSARKTDTTKRTDKATTTNKTVATADTKTTTPKTVEPPKADTAKVDVETAYRQGLQAFARGDTTAALASLRSSLAANPNYAPTWRGLGLVFEKMGEKDQARAAYKRYLQLAPSAGDSEIIKGRLERLGS